MRCWQEPRKSSIPATVNTLDESSSVSATDANSTVKESKTVALNKLGESSKPVCAENKEHTIVNGHAEIGASAHNGLVKVKQERPSTPPPSLDGPGDSNNNIQDKSTPLFTNTGSMSLPAGSSSRSHSSFRTSTESGVVSTEGQSSAVKKEEEPLSPIPALVPVGGQTAYVKSTLSTDQGIPEVILNAKSDNSQPSVKSEGGREGTGQPVELKSSAGSSEVKPNASVGSPRVDSSEGKVPETKPQLGSDTQIKQENESRISAQSRVPTGSEVKEESQDDSVQSWSDDDGVGAANNLLGDITDMQDDLEERMDEIERQLTG